MMLCAGRNSSNPSHKKKGRQVKIMSMDYHHDPVCCALNRDIFFPGPDPGAGTGAFACCCCCDSRAKLEAGSTVGGRVGRRDDDAGGNDGESMIATAGLFRSKTVSLIAEAAAPSRGPSSRVRGGAATDGGGVGTL